MLAKNESERGAIATPGLGPPAERRGGVCRSRGEAWRLEPNHRTKSPREEKKAEPADLEAGFCQSRGGAYGGGGIWGISRLAAEQTPR